MLNVGAPLTTPSGQPLLQVTEGSLTTTGSLATLGANLTLGGAFLAQSGGAVTTGADALAVGSHTLTSGATPVFDLTGGTLSTTNGSNLVSLNGGTANLGGPLLRLAMGPSEQTPTVNISGDVLHLASMVTGPPSGSLVSVTAGNLNVMGDLANVTSGAALNLTGSSLVAVSGTGSVGVTGDVLHVAETATVSNSATAGPVLLVGPGGTLTAGGAFLNSSGSVTLHSPMLELAGGNTGTGNTALLQVPTGTLSDSADLAAVSSTTTLGRSLLTVSGGAVSATNVLNVGAPLTTPSGQPVIQVADGSLSTTGSLATLGANLTLGGAFLAQSGGEVTTGADALAVGAATLTSGPFPVFDITGGILRTTSVEPAEGGIILHVYDLVDLGPGSTLNLGGPVLTVGGGDVEVGNVLNLGASLTTSSGQPVIHVTGGTLNTLERSLATLAANLTLGGPLLAQSGGEVTTGAALVVGSHTLTSGTAPVFDLTGGSLTSISSESATGSRLVSLAGGTANLGGPLLRLATGPGETTPTVFIGGNVLQVGSTVIGPPSGSLIDVSAGSLSATGALVNMEADTTLTLSGPVLSVSGTGGVTAANVVNLGAPLTTPSGQPLLAVSGGSLATTGSLATLSADLTLGGAFLAQSGGEVTAGGDALAVGASTLSSGTAPVFDLTGGTLSTTNGSNLVSLSGGTANLGAPLLSLAMGPGESTPTVNIAGDVLHIASTVTGPSSGSLVEVSAGSLTAGGDLVNLGADSTLTLSGPVLTVSGGEVAVANVLNLQAPLTTPAGQPVIQITGGTLGTTASLATLGADLTLGGVFLAQSGGDVTTGADALAVGSHTLTSGATPVFDLTGGSLTTTNDSHLVSLSGGTLTLGGPLLSLAMGPSEQTPTVNISGDLLHIASTVTGPSSGPLVSVGAGSLEATGDLVNLGAGSTLNLSGPVLTVSGGAVSAASVLSLGGPLTTPSGQPVIQMTEGSLSTTGSLATLGANLTLGGAFLAQSGGDVTTGADALAVGSHTLTSGTTPVFDLTGGSLTTTNGGHLVSLSGGTLTLGGLAPQPRHGSRRADAHRQHQWRCAPRGQHGDRPAQRQSRRRDRGEPERDGGPGERHAWGGAKPDGILAGGRQRHGERGRDRGRAARGRDGNGVQQRDGRAGAPRGPGGDPDGGRRLPEQRRHRQPGESGIGVGGGRHRDREHGTPPGAERHPQ